MKTAAVDSQAGSGSVKTAAVDSQAGSGSVKTAAVDSQAGSGSVKTAAVDRQSGWLRQCQDSSCRQTVRLAQAVSRQQL